MESNEECIEIDVQLDKKTLNHFLLRNNFLRTGGVIGLLIILESFWRGSEGDPAVSGVDVYSDPASYTFDEGLGTAKKRSFSRTLSLHFYTRRG